MGFKEGEGLGKFGQGRKEIVETSTQRGRRGLGLTLQGFEGDLNVEWKDEDEVRTMFPLSLLRDYIYTYTSYPICQMCSCVILYIHLCLCLSLSQPTAFEEVSWFPECTTEMPDSEELRDWMTIGEVL